MSKKVHGSGLVLSGVDANQMVTDNGRSLSSWVAWEPTNLQAKIGASGAMPSWVPEPVKQFLTEPAPSSTAAMVGVTAAGAGASHLLGRFGGVQPEARAILGAGVVIAGHYVLESWQAKSVGYGALFEGLVEVVRRKVDPASAAQPVQPARPVDGPGSSNVLEEMEFLEIVERDTRALPTTTAPTGQVVPAVDAQKAREWDAFFTNASVAYGPMREPLDGRVPVRLSSGEIITVVEYLRRFPERIAERKRRGSAARSRRANPAMRDEADYLQERLTVCRAMMRGERLPESGVRLAFDIRLPDGTFRTEEDYRREMAWKLRLIDVVCDREPRGSGPSTLPQLTNGGASTGGSEPGSAPPAGAGGSSGEGGSTSGVNSLRDRILGTQPSQPQPGEMFTLVPSNVLANLAGTTITANATQVASRPKIDPNLMINQTMTGSAGLKHRKTR